MKGKPFMDDLYHYYEKSAGPFRNLSDLPAGKAQEILDGIKRENAVFAAHRFDGYLKRRRELEQTARDLFIAKGGRPRRAAPHYMVVGACEWLKTWYRDAAFVRIPAAEFDMSAVSFSYGDMFPTFSPRVNDGKEYRRRVYTFEEILELIGRYGLPQEWNEDGRSGPERYVEAHVWSDDCLRAYYVL
jgi:hypothetical protein